MGNSCCTTKNDRITEIKQDRGCSDVIPLLAFIVSWAGVVALLLMAQKQGGDPNKIIRGIDGFGRMCGVHPEVADFPMAAFPYPAYLSSTDWWKAMVCVKDCNETRYSTKMSWPHISEKLGFYCVPTLLKDGINITISGSPNADFAKYFGEAQRAVGDLNTARFVVGCSVIIAIVVLWMWLWLLRKFAKLMVYSMLLLVAIAGFFIADLFMNWAADAQVNGWSPDIVDYLKYASYFFTGATGVFLLVVFFLRNQIDIAIEVVRESGTALLDMPFLSLFPIWPAILVVSYFALWVYGGLFIFSTADKEIIPAPNNSRNYSAAWLLYKSDLVYQINEAVPANITRFPINSSLSKYGQWYYLFHMFWVTQFLYYFCYLVFTGAGADWYFAATDQNGKKRRGTGPQELTNWPVMNSFKRALLYHMGTVAVCAFIIAVIKTLRALVMYAERQTKGEPPNRLQKAIFCCLSCYLKCVECCMDKVNKYSLVWTAVYGDGFCVACCSSFALVWRNLFRVAAINGVSTVIFMMGKIKVSFATGSIVCAILIYVEPYKSDINSPLVPSLVSAMLAYAIAALFYVVVNGVIDTIFLCFLIDSEVNGKGQMLASAALQKLVGKYSKQSGDIAKESIKTRRARPSADGVEDFHQDAQEMKHLNQTVEG